MIILLIIGDGMGISSAGKKVDEAAKKEGKLEFP